MPLLLRYILTSKSQNLRRFLIFVALGYLKVKLNYSAFRTLEHLALKRYLSIKKFKRGVQSACQVRLLTHSREPLFDLGEVIRELSRDPKAFVERVVNILIEMSKQGSLQPK